MEFEHINSKKKGAFDPINTILTPWSREQINFAEDFLIKTSKRLLLEQEASLHYRRRNYAISIPSLVLGSIASCAAFSQWSNTVLCESANWVWLVIAFIFVTSTILNGLKDHVLNFRTLSQKHHETYKGLTKIIKAISNELGNPASEHQPYREFMDKIITDYNHYTDDSELIPYSVTKTVSEMLRKAELRQIQREKDLHGITKTQNYFPSTELPPEYATPGMLIRNAMNRSSSREVDPSQKEKIVSRSSSSCSKNQIEAISENREFPLACKIEMEMPKYSENNREGYSFDKSFKSIRKIFKKPSKEIELSSVKIEQSACAEEESATPENIVEIIKSTSANRDGKKRKRKIRTRRFAL